MNIFKDGALDTFTCRYCGKSQRLCIWERLSVKATKIAELLLEGYSTAGMVKQLGMPTRTIKFYLSSMYQMIAIDKDMYDPRVRLARILWEDRPLRTKKVNSKGTSNGSFSSRGAQERCNSREAGNI